MKSSRKKINSFLVMWDMLGLETIYDLNEAKHEINKWEANCVWKRLKDESLPKKPNPIPFGMMKLRAQANPQRNYEIYSFTTELSKKEITDVFESDPQIIVDWIRINGNKHYSDYHQYEKRIA